MGSDRYSFKQDEKLVKWEPKHPEVILTHINARKLKDVGDKVNFKFRWMSDGVDKCPARHYSAGKYCETVFPCAHHSVSCLAGTGDFRIGFYDTLTNKADHIENDNFADADRYGGINKQLSSKPFDKYRGYHFRLYPHISHKATKYIDKKTGSHIPCGFYIKDADGLFSSHRINDSHGCFELKPGKWGTLKFQIKKTKRDAIELSWEMNGFAYSTEHVYTHSDYQSKFMPHYVDTVAIMYPNGRRYYYIEFAGEDLDEHEKTHEFAGEGGEEKHKEEHEDIAEMAVKVGKASEEGGILSAIVEEAMEIISHHKKQDPKKEDVDEEDEPDEPDEPDDKEDEVKETPAEKAAAAAELTPSETQMQEAIADMDKDEVADESEKIAAANDIGEDEIDREALKLSYQKTAPHDPVELLEEAVGLKRGDASDSLHMGRSEGFDVINLTLFLVGICGVAPTMIYMFCRVQPPPPEPQYSPSIEAARKLYGIASTNSDKGARPSMPGQRSVPELNRYASR